MNDAIDNLIKQQVELALLEDVGPGDITTLACIETCDISAEIVAKSDGIVAGIDLAKAAFLHFNKKINLTIGKSDGSKFVRGDRIITITGNSQAVLMAERTALNFLGHLSGIASLTAQFVKKVEGTSVKILDTRKTTPGLRYLEKYAVTCGGGVNHRFGLYDMALIKDNHISAAGSISTAVKKMKEFLQSNDYRTKFAIPPEEIEIEVEIKNEKELREAIDCGVKRILLDNQTPDSLKTLVNIARQMNKKLVLEASGNVKLDNVRAIAESGVDLISIGALTHSAISSDFSLKVIE
ncbi:MAG: carboxylating nicotinate-nucleotide diphosphorylase [Candidatus Zixiibacteriota bacterium]